MPVLRARGSDIAVDVPVLMGVVNASPESFSDGGLYATVEDQAARARELVVAGAGIVDIGGESGVTGVAPLTAAEEIRRVVPLVERLVDAGIVVSVDTWKPEVALAVLAAGAHIINDVSGLRDPALADACAEHDAGLVLMHTRAEPKHKDFPRYGDVVGDVVSFLHQQMDEAVRRGVAEEAIVVDPGPDFAKTPAQTVEVLRRLGAVVALGRPVLLAVSRKDFIGVVTGRSPRQRDAGTLAAVGEGLDAGASILRVHDVAATADFLAVRAVLRGEREIGSDRHLPTELRRERG